MNQFKQSTHIAINVSIKLLPFLIQIALIVLTIVWLNHGLARAYNDQTVEEQGLSIDAPISDSGDPCIEHLYANIVEPGDADDPCAEEGDTYVKHVAPFSSDDECEEVTQLVSFDVNDSEDDPCADEDDAYVKFVQPFSTDDECLEQSSDLALTHLEFPNDIGQDCQEVESASAGPSA